jgi:3-oxoacyl-[acyl-carrier-protein] synthase II
VTELGAAAAVVGAGVVTPAGSTVDEVWRSLLRADQTRAEVRTFEELASLTALFCPAQGFEPGERLGRHEMRRLDRLHQMAIWAADDALTEAGASPTPARCAVVVGIGFGAPRFLDEQLATLRESGPRAVSPLTIPVVMPNSVAGTLSLRYGFTGPSMTVAMACASGAAAIGEALWLLRTGRADRVLAGGVEAPLTGPSIAFFSRMEAMSSRFDSPTTASRPFDESRDGFVLAEGASFVVLERASHDRDRLGTVLGYTTNSDAHHMVAPPPGGTGAAACMRAALADAGVDVRDIGHINAHGTSTQRNDAAEAAAIEAVFADHPVPVTATKGVVGHLIAGAGALEAVMTLRAIAEGIVPPIANLTAPDPEVDLLLARRAVAPSGPLALSNSFGFGGHNATLVLGP